jgi:hypothetical protein
MMREVADPVQQPFSVIQKSSELIDHSPLIIYNCSAAEQEEVPASTLLSPQGLFRIARISLVGRNSLGERADIVPSEIRDGLSIYGDKAFRPPDVVL